MNSFDTMELDTSIENSCEFVFKHQNKHLTFQSIPSYSCLFTFQEYVNLRTDFTKQVQISEERCMSSQRKTSCTRLHMGSRNENKGLLNCLRVLYKWRTCRGVLDKTLAKQTITGKHKLRTKLLCCKQNNPDNLKASVTLKAKFVYFRCL